MADSCTGMALWVTLATMTGIAAARGAGAACSFEQPEAASRMRKNAARNPGSEPKRNFDSDLATAVGRPSILTCFDLIYHLEAHHIWSAILHFRRASFGLRFTPGEEPFRER